ncbi:MAG: DUF1272 domain-containing protein [Phenylobacterium sp.]|nr:DUF1272 domain-containing protein [Phenylobacterium sp.]MCA6240144.1 DUF1272 domain-containing protein [Phenylobacterium sp.]MCA6261835.1 DUF1272 domain-containing protein [Phenylobacterium sp.]
MREAAIPTDQAAAFICSFECAFCEACACVLLPRPPRATAPLERFPPQA